MIVIPAIDIKNGRCVRLRQGKMSHETVYSNIPAEMAKKWFDEGAERLHIVDLDGAVGGKPVNKDVVKDIVDSVPIPVQLGGGIRKIETIDAYLDIGVNDVILGTAAYKDPDFIKEACLKYPGRVILGIDAKNGHVAIEGWVEETDITAENMAKKYESLGISAIIYTDIQRDGMSTGPNLEATKKLAQAIEIPVIASGGISGIEDVINIQGLADFGVSGMITGKALYEGTLDLSEAIKKVKNT
jgi:phosphoribosylformimino-5-aminoimidazole carboxamide ribotide isomerase